MFRVLVLLLMITPAAVAQTPSSADVRPLWPEGVPNALARPTPEVEEEPGRVAYVSTPTLTVFRAPDATRSGAAVIICPGGGYRRLAVSHEGYDVAAWLNTLGVSAFVLKYRVPEFGHPAPLQDVLRAVRLVRSNATAWGVDPTKIGVLGFSAGGHLAGSAATLFDDAAGRTKHVLDAVSARPDFQVLVYPVISMANPTTHVGSREYLLGKAATPEMIESLSLEKRVTRQTPPAFLVHGGNDASVPVENSLAYYQALRTAGVPADLHVYQHGPHGVGIRPGNGPISDWPKRCEEWMRARGLIR